MRTRQLQSAEIGRVPRRFAEVEHRQGPAQGFAPKLAPRTPVKGRSEQRGDPAGLCAGSLTLLKNLSGLGIGLPMKIATDRGRQHGLRLDPLLELFMQSLDRIRRADRFPLAYRKAREREEL